MSLDEIYQNKGTGLVKLSGCPPRFVSKDVTIWTFTDIGKYKYGMLENVFGFKHNQIMDLLSEGVDYIKIINPYDPEDYNVGSEQHRKNQELAERKRQGRN